MNPLAFQILLNYPTVVVTIIQHNLVHHNSYRCFIYINMLPLY